MPEYINKGSGDLGIVLIMVLIAVCVVLSLNADRHDRATQPCSEYANAKLKDVPARCLTPQGGFKND